MASESFTGTVTLCTGKIDPGGVTTTGIRTTNAATYEQPRPETAVEALERAHTEMLRYKADRYHRHAQTAVEDFERSEAARERNQLLLLTEV